MKILTYSSFKLFFFLLIFHILYAKDNDIQQRLNDFSKKNALSQKTIDENKGHLILFTREKLEKMHAKTLKDVFKTTPVVYYHENRYALPDPLAGGIFEPYRSNFVRLYVDGVEITQGWMGSGLMLYGDVNIDFVDHIEFYYMIPSFDTSVEPAYLTVFLYSKNPARDSDTKVNLLVGSKGYNSQTVSIGENKKNYAYMVNFSHTNDKREKVDNGTSRPLNRDFERMQLFSYLKTDNQFFHMQLMKKNSESLAGMSYDATPLESQIDYLNLHMDYGIDFNTHWHAQIAYDWLKTDMAQLDDNPLAWSDALGVNHFYGTYKNSMYTGEITYKKTIANHRVSSGIKGRYKVLDTFERDGKDALIKPFTSEEFATIFFQDQYVWSQQELLTFGISYSHIGRNGGIESDNLLQARLGYIYTSEQWSYKTYLYRTQYALEPFTRYLDMDKFQHKELQTTLGLTQEIGYEENDYHLRLILLAMKDENGLLENGLEGNTNYFFSILNFDYDFDMDNKINTQLYYAYYKDIFDLDRLEDISGYFSFYNSYENVDFYNGIVWHRNSLDWKNYLDFTSTISWNINNNLTLILKGENLLDRAKKTNLFRLNPETGSIVAPLSISPIDQRITLELEYLF